MPIPTHTYRITNDTKVIRVQSTTPGTETPGSQTTPPGAAETEGAFGVLGMMISGLIIIFAIVLLYLRSRNRR
ncbi:hypothetical protein [Microvirga terrestris]|uniref:LPXTG cell wall anchor domain-containing protein n=1 Tax=Microvirga terrestris TaxID=2791024 RepID=A0ABS0HSS5_9HYPH|nr:hypothetical protein [Microvirga terrestris]MBF9196464.1 hypothetical protein [Microvirga terrestris]